IAKQSPRQSDPLPLPSRQRLTAIADFGVVPVRHLLDHLMYTGKAGGANDPSMVRLSEPGNVLRHRAGKEFNVLRKVADIRPELVWIELIARETTEPDGSRSRRPDPQEHTDQARFARGARADNGKCPALFKLERDAAQYRSAGAGRHGKNLLERDRSLRRRQLHPPHILRIGTEEVL